MLKIKFLMVWALLALSLSTYAQRSDVVNLKLDVHFKTSMSTLPVEDYKIIDEIYEIYKNHPNLKILVSGHTDSMGSQEVNQTLSDARAQLIYNRLVSKGIKEVDMKYRGFGESAPIATNKTKKGRAQNRRVVVTFSNVSEDLKKELLQNKKDGLSALKKENDSVEQSWERSPEDTEAQEILAAEPESLMEEKKESEPAPHAAVGGWGRYELGGFWSQTHLNANDLSAVGSGVEADWVSEHNFGLTGAYQLFIKERYWLGLRASYEFQTYKDQKDPAYAWDKEDPSLFRVAFIADYEKTKWGLGLDIFYMEQPFIREDATVVTLEKDSMLGASLRGKYRFYKKGKWSSRLGLNLDVPFSNLSGELQAAGNPLGASIYLDFAHQTFKSHELVLGVRYTHSFYEHDRNEQTNQRIGLQLSLRNLKWL